MKVENTTKDMIERKLKLDSIQKFLKTKESMGKTITIPNLRKSNSLGSVLLEEFDSEDETEIEKIKSEYIKFSLNDKNKQYSQELSIFGENPIILYQKVVMFLDEEFTKLEKIKEKESEFYLKQYQVCNNIFSKIELISRYLSSIPIVQHIAGGDIMTQVNNSSGSNNDNNQVSSIFNSRNIINNIISDYPKIMKQHIKRLNIKKNKMFICSICEEKFPNGQALGKIKNEIGGHMSRMHPHKSEKYMHKKEIRNSRKDHRDALREAKEFVLHKNGLSFDKLCKNREGKKIIKQTVNHNKDEFKRILKNIKVEKGLIKFENN